MRRAGLTGLLAALLLSGCGGGGMVRTAATRSPAQTAVERSVQRYFHALAVGDARATCEAVTDDSRRQLADFARERLRLRHPSCQATVRALEHSSLRAHLRSLRDPQVERIHAGRRRATAFVPGSGEVKLERDRDGWKVVATPSGEAD